MFNKVACIHITTDYSLKIHIFHKLDVTEKWPFIVRCSKEHYVHCKVCGSNFSIKHAGKFDITRHVQCPKHIQRTKDVPLSKSLEDFVKAVIF